MASKKSSAWAELGAAGVGALIGGALGLLFSPKSGAQNRKMIAKEAKKAATAVSKATAKASAKPKKKAASKKKGA